MSIELEGDELDRAVALALGWSVRGDLWVGPTGITGRVTRDDMPAQVGIDKFSPSMNWSQGGPIIERERIELWFRGMDGNTPMWSARCCRPDGLSEQKPSSADSPLLAAMRAFVASRAGSEGEAG